MNTFVRVRTMTVLALAASVAYMAACGDSPTAAGRGTLAVRLTDAPFPTDSVSSVDIFVVRVDGRVADTDSAAAEKDSAGTNGWTTLATPNISVNLLAYQNGASLPLGTATLTEGSYHGFRLIIDPSKSSVTLKNGMVLTGTSSPNIAFPSGSRTGIKIVLTKAVEVVASDTTTMLVDFDVANSFVLRGSTILQNGLLFKPVVKATTQ
ncbi:MAG: DUF4382 domain-containing protein [Gemmatimonadaceae bacterium]